MSAGRFTSKQRREPRGIPFEVPSNETFIKKQTSFEHGKDRNPSNSQVRSAFQVGRDTLDGPTPSHRGRERHLNGSRSLVVNTERRKEGGKRAEGEARNSFGNSDPKNPYSLSHFASGVPSGSNITRPQRALKLRQKSPSPENSSRSASTQNVPQYRNASADTGKIISFSVSPSTIRTRSAARKSQGRDEPIVLDDSEEEEPASREHSPSSHSSESHVGVSITNRENYKSYNSRSRSPEESITTSGDVEIEESRLITRQNEDVGSHGKERSYSHSSDKTEDPSSESPKEERNRLHKQDTSLSPEIPQINQKSFHIAQPQDASRLRVVDRMKGKDGQTRSMIDQRLMAKNKVHDHTLYNSGLNARSHVVSGREKTTTVKLERIAFELDGFIGHERNPAVDFSASAKAFKIRWEGDGGSIEGQTIVIDHDDCESLHASKESLSASKEPYRLLLIVLLDDSRTARHLKERLEAVKGFGAVHGGTRVILEASHGGSQEEQDWVNFRRKLTMLRSRPLKDLNESDSRLILHKKLDPLIPAREKQNLPSLSDKSSSRPKARPSALNGSNPFASKPLENRQRTSDARGLRPREETGPHAQDGRNIGTQPRPSTKRTKSPSPKKVLDPNKRLLNYPFRVTSGGSVAILQSDFDRLDPGEFLNDTMIDFGLKFLLEQVRERDPDLHKDIFVFSSFFYNRINEKKSDRKVGYELVKKWTKKAELFSKKYIVVPINENLHWYLAIIVNPLFAIPEEIRNGRNRVMEAEADSKYTSAISSPTSGTEKMNEDEITYDSDLFAGDVSAQHQHVPEVDGDGDRKMIPVQDRRTNVEGYQTSDVSDAISNDGGGTLVGGGDKRKGNPFEPGESFSFEEEEASKRSRRVITSRLVEPSSSSEEIGPSSFYGKGSSAKSSEIVPRHSPEFRRSTRSSGPASPVTNYDALNSRRSSINPSQDLSETWRKQLNEGATVCVFDSLQQKHGPVKTAMKHYLAYEYADKNCINEQIDVKSIELNMIDVTMPRQPNWADCGLYLLHAFERFFSDPKAFKDDVIPAKNENHTAWKSEQALDLRRSWKATIERLSVEYQEEHQKRQRALQEKRAKRKEEEESLPATEEGIDDERQEVTEDVKASGTESVELLEKLRSPDADQHDAL